MKMALEEAVQVENGQGQKQWQIRTGKSKHLWYGFIFLLGILIVILDQTITDVVVPSIVEDLKIAASSATLLVTIYMVVGAAFMILMGKVVDVLGRGLC